VLAGLGLKSFWQDCDAADFKKLYLHMAVAFTLLIALYLGTAQAALRQGLLKPGEPVMPSRRLANDLPLFNMLNIRYILAPTETSLSQIPDLKNIASLDLNVYESGMFGRELSSRISCLHIKEGKNSWGY
jgi:hypothetical protein